MLIDMAALSIILTLAHIRTCRVMLLLPEEVAHQRLDLLPRFQAPLRRRPAKPS